MHIMGTYSWMHAVPRKGDFGGLPFEGRGWGWVFGLGVVLVSLCGRSQGPHPAVGCLRITIFILCVRRCNFMPRQFSSWTGLRSMIFHYHLRIGEVWTIRNNKSDPLPTEHIHCTEKFVPLQGKKQDRNCSVWRRCVGDGGKRLYH